ncbi:MAG: DUF2306 domain-containing protein [Hellea sp.]|nr:DUF2306 domain-containing protein [Hellea sp.]
MNFDLFFSAGPAVIIHTIVAFGALILGTIMWLRKKGTRSHKMIGRIFVMFMAVTAISALFITGLNGKYWSWIHLFVPLSFYAIWELFYYLRKGNIVKHQKAVKGLFFGALLIPGILAFLPGRLMWHVAFG